MAFPGITKALSGTFRHLTGVVKNTFDTIRDAVMGIWEKINALATAIPERINHAVTAIFDHIWGASKLFITRLSQATLPMMGTFNRIWKAIFDRFVQMARWTKARLGKAVVDTVDHVFGKLSDLFVAVKMFGQWIQEWGNALVHMLKNFPQAVAGVLAEAFSYVVDEVGDVLDSWIDRHWED
jgi:phage-related protein